MLGEGEIMNARTNKGIGSQLVSLVGGVITICGVALCGVPMAQPMVHASLSPAVSSSNAVRMPLPVNEEFRFNKGADAPQLAMANKISGEDR